MILGTGAIADLFACDPKLDRLARYHGGERDFDLYDEKDNFAEQLNRLEERRREAINEVFSHGGVEAVLEFARAVKSPSRVGYAFGSVASTSDESKIFPNLLESEEKPLSQFTGGFVWARYGVKGWQWVDSLNTAQWTPSQKAQFLAYLPFMSETWTRAGIILGPDESLYWSKVSANPFQTEAGLELAIDRLLQNGRVHEAVLCIERIIHDRQPLDNQQAIRTLHAVLESPGTVITHDAYAIVDIIRTLQETPKSDVGEVLNIEWAFLPLLDEQYEASPKLLEQKLADEPNFFCEVIRLIFRSRNKEVATEERSEQQGLVAANGYRLLHRWKTPPGSHRGQPFNGEALNDWLAVVKTSCAESGHLEVALQRVGNVLFYSPPDPNGLWLDHSVASVLNARDADDIRTGFQTEIFKFSRCVLG